MTRNIHFHCFEVADFMIVKRESKILISLIKTLHSSKANGLRAKLDGNLLAVIKNVRKPTLFLLQPAVRIKPSRIIWSYRYLKFKILRDCPLVECIWKLKAACEEQLFLVAPQLYSFFFTTANGTERKIFMNSRLPYRRHAFNFFFLLRLVCGVE